MLDILDLPLFLSKHSGKFDNAKMLCILDKQIKMPNHLEKISKSSSNLAALVDVIGVDLGGRKYVVKGKIVVILGPRAFEPTKYGKRVLLLNGNLILKDLDTNYVEMTLIYNTAYGNSLYATRTLFREIPEIRNVYPDFMKCVDEIAQSNWDIDSYFLKNYNIDNNYHICCSNADFELLSDENKFVYKSDEEYWKIQNFKSKIQENEKINTNMSCSKSISVESRKNILEKSKYLQYLESNKEIARKKVEKKLNELESNTYDSKDTSETLTYIYKQIKMYWRNTPNLSAATGRALFKNLMEYMYPDYKNKYEDNKPIIDNAIDNNKLLDIWYTGNVPNKLQGHSFYEDVAMLKEGLYIGLLDYLLTLRHHLLDAYSYSETLGIDFLNVISTNPYYLALVDSRLNIEDLDKLGMFFNVDMSNSEIIKFRNAAYLHNFLLDSNNDIVEENTILLESDVYNCVMTGYILSSRNYGYLNTYGCIISEKVLYNLKYYVNSNISSQYFALPKNNWIEKKMRGTSKYILNFNNINKYDVVQDYLDSGLGVKISLNNQNYIIDYTYLSKELYIMNRLYELQEKGEKPILKSEDVEKCIRAFERLKSLEWNISNFKLEERQADAVRCLYNPIMCVTGPAGSGKTTTAEAILFGLQALLGVSEEDIMFCAPTGRAANRLKEIVKKPTRTIHSLFDIGGESYTLLNDKNVKKKSEIKVLIVDESSMINLELMYNMISKISDGTRIIFLGDKDQLPPIGPGKPFTNILSFAPCIVLNVLKRASEKSGITKNAQSIIYDSDTSNPPELEDYDDFRILETPKNKIATLISGIVNYHLGRAGAKRVGDTKAAKRVLQSLDVNLSPDDIQVVTPVNKYEWGTKNLNKVLQDVFNPKLTMQEHIRVETGLEDSIDEFGKTIQVMGYQEFRLNDRVIHLENMASKERYLQRGKNTFEKINDSFGVMNGDIGKVVGFITGNNLMFLKSDGSEDEETKKSFSDSQDTLYVAVSYLDVDSLGSPLEFVIFYKTDIMYSFENDEKRRNEKCITVESNDLRRLDLAYALTVHKLQGSQAKLIICVMYPVGFSNFISRNMIYTALTRAVKGIYLVGNVTGWRNAISVGRKIEQNAQRATLIDKIY